jgi:hypothetical protein
LRRFDHFSPKTLLPDFNEPPFGAGEDTVFCGFGGRLAAPPGGPFVFSTALGFLLRFNAYF